MTHPALPPELPEPVTSASHRHLAQDPLSPVIPSSVVASPEQVASEFSRSSSLLAQAITPAPDGAGTIVTPQGSRLDITGGQLSGDGTNLFHSFSQFGLSQGQIANFLSNPAIRNILGRVTGGEASLLNGTLQVTGGNSNLYLLNPAGILFGPTASLNLPAAFTATTATAIAFNHGWFSATGINQYANLEGSPAGFAFAGSQPGAIVNTGALAVQPGQHLSLMGGTVINTGQLIAPAGQLTIAAVPGNRYIRLSQPGTLLSLELPDTALPGDALVRPLTLPELLTGGPSGQATAVTVNSAGEVVLTDSGRVIPATSGTTVVTGTLDGTGAVGGTIWVLGDRVGIVGASIQASGNQGGGTVLIGGDYRGQGAVPNATQTYVDASSTIRADALQQGNGGRVIIWADGTTVFNGTLTARGATATSSGGLSEISGKEHLMFRGAVDLSAPNGTPGSLLLDPTDITIVPGIGGSQDGSLPTVLFGLAPTTFTLSQTALQSQLAAVTLEASNTITIAPGVTLNFAAGGGPITFRADADGNGVGAFIMDPTQTIRTSGRDLTIIGANLTIGTLNTDAIAAGNSRGGTVNLLATNTITTGPISTAASTIPPGTSASAIAGSIIATAGGDITTDSLTAFANTPPVTLSTARGGIVALTAGGNLTFTSIDTRATTAVDSQGGNVFLTANGLIRGTASGDTILTASPTQSGRITIQHTGGPQNSPFTVGDATSLNGVAGALNAGTSLLRSGSYPVLPAGGVAAGTPSLITITSLNQAPSLTINSTLSGAVQNQPFQFTYADLAPIVTDGDSDRTTLQIATLTSGTLTVNGATVIPGVTPLAPGDVLVYTPQPGVTGTLANVFSVRASDGIALSTNTAPVNITVASPVNPNPINPINPINPNPNNPGTTLIPGTGSSTIAIDPTGNLVNNPRPAEQRRLDGNQVSSLLLNDLSESSRSTIAASLAPLPCSSTDVGVYTIEDRFTREYEEYLGKQLNRSRTMLLDACQALNTVEAATGVKPAIVYVSFSEQQSLELIAITPTGAPIYRRFSNMTRAEVLSVAQEFIRAVTGPANRNSNIHLKPAQQLHQWLVAPLEKELATRQVKNLVFVLDDGLRSLPIAALHDGKQYLIEKYSLGVMPSLSLTDTRYRNLGQSQILAMGVSEFKELPPLPAVPVEISTIVQVPWSGRALLNEELTLSNLKSQRQQRPFGIVHLATHAEFTAGDPDNSYIQLWNTRLQPSQIRQLGWNDPPVELLVLSACRTALGDEQAELGFAGMAYQMGVRSVLASLWAVDDEGTLALMSEFYHQLKTTATRSEAVRQAQLAMLRKQIRVEQGTLVTSRSRISLPPEVAFEGKDLSYPYYWAAFTLIGNPW